jgi:hypothetical protein
MKALQISRYGAPKDVVELVDLPEPHAPKADEVLVAVEYPPINMGTNNSIGITQVFSTLRSLEYRRLCFAVLREAQSMNRPRHSGDQVHEDADGAARGFSISNARCGRALVGSSSH